MSIYPVSIKEWFKNGNQDTFGKEWLFLKKILPGLKCEQCDGPVTENGYVMHSITYGGPDEAWCSEKCLKGEK